MSDRTEFIHSGPVIWVIFEKNINMAGVTKENLVSLMTNSRRRRLFYQIHSSHIKKNEITIPKTAHAIYSDSYFLSDFKTRREWLLCCIYTCRLTTE